MAKVDWITWKTDPSEIINPDKVGEKISNIFKDYNCYMNSVVYEGILHEIEKGGLDKMSLNLLGTSPANESAIDILENITEIKEIINSLQEDVLKSAEEQKEIEKNQLIQVIEEKILEEENKLNNTLSLKEKIHGKLQWLHIMKPVLLMKTRS